MMDQQTTTEPSRYSYERKNERFRELANQRVGRLLKGMYLVGNLSNKASYAYSEAESEALIGAIERGLDDLKALFKVAQTSRRPKHMNLFG